MKNNGKSRWRVKMCLAEGPPDRQISVDCAWQLLLDSVFAIHRRSVLEPRATPIDKNAYEVHFLHFENKQMAKDFWHGNKHYGRWVLTVNTDAKWTCHMYYKDRWGKRPKIGLGVQMESNSCLWQTRLLAFGSACAHVLGAKWEGFRIPPVLRSFTCGTQRLVPKIKRAQSQTS